MTGMEENRFSWLVEHTPQAASAIAISVGSLVLCGWTFDLMPLKSVFSGLVAMKVNTALGFMLAGISLWNTSPHAHPPLPRIVSRVCASGVLLLGLLTIGEYLSGKNLGIDQLVMEDITNLPGDIPGRMAANSAATFTALGTALVLLTREKGGFELTIHILAIGIILMAGGALVGYGYNIEAFLRAKLNYTPMAIHTAATFVFLGLGILTARPDYPFRRIMTSENTAGVTTRRLLPAAIGFPLVIGWVLAKGFQAGYLSEAVSLALFAVVNMCSLSALVQWNAVRQYQIDVLRQRAEQALQNSEKKYRNLVNNLQEGIWSIDVDTRTVFVNPRMAEMLGYTVEEMLGRDLFSFMDESTMEIASQHIERRRQGIKEHYELDFLRKDGTRISASLEASPLYDDDGHYTGALAGVTDMTAHKQLEAKLAEVSAYTRSLIEASLDPLVTISAEGKITDVNEATVQATGLAREALIGSDFSNYFTEPDKARAGYQEVFAKGFVMDYPLTMRHASGSTMEVLYNASVYRNENGEVAGVFAAARDVTRVKQAERLTRERVKELQAFFYLSELTARKDFPLDSLCQELTNILPASWQYTNITCARIVIRESEFRTANFSLSEWMISAPVKVLSAVIGKVEVGYLEPRPEEDEGPFLKEERQLIDALAERVGQITELKNAETEIKRLNANLEKTVQARIAELRSANIELDSFAYAVTHNLRAPLRAMSGFSHALMEEYGEQLDSNARGYLDQIGLASRHMSNLIDGLLALFRSTRGELKQEALDISAMAERLLADMAAADPARRVAWTVESGMQAEGDATMIETVMRHLIDNAWKFTGKTPDAIIRVYSKDTEGQRCFCVYDNGAGFDRAHAGKLYQPFQRLHRQEEFPGTGIGLAMVQRIVHRHGGTIWADGAPGQGATFCFILQSQPFGQGDLMNTPRTILLVEDNPQDEILILRSLHKAKLANRIDVARDGQQALDYLFCQGEYASRKPEDLPTVVLLDIGLPRLSGLEVLERLRTDSRTRLLPVVILTSSDEDRDRLKSYQSGANSFVRKPVNFAEFAETVAQLGVYWLATNLPPQG